MSQKSEVRDASARIQFVMLRHGESVWNKENRFTGWKDVELSDAGRAEAHRAGRELKSRGMNFDRAFTSYLKRAIHTLDVVLNELDSCWLPVEKSWRLNERHYGGLMGLNKSETAAKHGEAQVKIWRRSYSTPPPMLTMDHPDHPSKDRRYSAIPAAQLPLGESLAMTVERVVPYWNERILPALKSGERVLIAAHGNSLRALIKHLEKISEADIVEMNIPTAVPLLVTLNSDFSFHSKEYLGDAETIASAMHSVASQGKA